jgi:eukaryotic-like serine/threonine-protein kinase
MTVECFGRYEVRGQIGSGGMADVYRAYDPVLEREVAVKVIRKDVLATHRGEQLLKRFKQEATLVAGLSHPNIARVLDFGWQQDQPYLVMEILAGGSLKQQLESRQGRRYPWREAAQLLAPVAHALQAAHDAKIIHRDVKPANILFNRYGAPILTDFGIAKILESTENPGLTVSGKQVGTPAYMAPEQAAARKDADHRVDIYALGIVLYELITGRRPSPAGVSAEPPQRPSAVVPDLPVAIDTLVMKAMAWNPQERYAQIGELATALEDLARGASPSLSPPVPASPARSKRLWIVGGSILASFCLLTILGAGLARLLPFSPFFPTRSPTPSPTTTQVPAIPTATRTQVTLTQTSIITTEPTHTGTRDDGELIFIPAGDFLMGSDPGEPYFWGAEHPKHTVSLDAYWIYRTEVTNAMYRECVQAGTCQPPAQIASASHPDYFTNPKYNDYPVTNVTHADAAAYCTWAGARLPTEAEWEKAARGTDGALFPWGDDEVQASFANFCDRYCPEQDPKYKEKHFDDGYADLAPVGSFPDGASPYDVLDMAGNVIEWVADWYDPNYYLDSPAENPAGPANGTRYILHGGSWRSIREGLRPAARIPKDMDYSSNYTGFRCAVDEP